MYFHLPRASKVLLCPEFIPLIFFTSLQTFIFHSSLLRFSPSHRWLMKCQVLKWFQQHFFSFSFLSKKEEIQCLPFLKQLKKGAIQITRDSLGQCFSTFLICGMHPSLVFLQFGSTPICNLLVNTGQVQKLVAALDFSTAHPRVPRYPGWEPLL